MADLSDITAYLKHQAALAVYPNGTGQASVANMDVRIFEGWPTPDQLDLDLSGQMLQGNPPIPVPRPGGPAANVSIYPMLGATSAPFQILDDTYTIIPPSYGLAFSVAGAPGDINNTQGGYPTVTLTGTPKTGEYITLIADRQFIYSATGATAASIISQLLTAAQVNYPSASSTSSTITIPAAFDFTCRQGVPATLGKVTHRQIHAVMITTWAPNHVARSAIAAAIDVALKTKITVTMTDTSGAKIVYSRTNQTDEYSTVTLYRRDLIYDVEYATLQQFPGYVITSVSIQEQNGNWGLTTNPPQYTFLDRAAIISPPFPPNP